MSASFPELMNILKVLSLKPLPKRLNPTILTALIQEHSDFQIDELNKQYKEGRQELVKKIVELGYCGDIKKLHLNDLWNLLGELESTGGTLGGDK